MYFKILWDIQKNIEAVVKEALNTEEIKDVKRRNNKFSCKFNIFILPRSMMFIYSYKIDGELTLLKKNYLIFA